MPKSPEERIRARINQSKQEGLPAVVAVLDGYTQYGCLDCLYWCDPANRDDPIDGQCRYAPPVVHTSVSKIRDTCDLFPETFWPITKPDDWCGKWTYDSPD